MTEFLVYCLFGTVIFLFMVLRLNTPKQHNWHDVSSADVAKAIRKRKAIARGDTVVYEDSDSIVTETNPIIVQADPGPIEREVSMDKVKVEL